MSKETSLYNHDLQVVGEVHVGSSWQQAREHRSSHAQTEPLRRGVAECQTIISALQTSAQCDKEVEVKSRQSNVPAAQVDGMQFVYPGPHFDNDELADFLEAVVDEISDTIANNNKSAAFDGYQPSWTEKLDTVRQFTTLTAPFVLEDEYHVTGISWNCTGSTIAVGYGRVDTVGWCKKKGYVAVWNLRRRDMNPNHPDITLETGAHVTAVAFHPSNPAMLAAGTYNGEVVIWNLATDESANGQESGTLNAPMSSFASGSSPKEPISRLQWLQNLQEQQLSRRYVLCSASQDGKVLFWNPHRKLEQSEACYDVQNRKHCIIGVQGLAFMHSGRGVGNKGQASHTPSVDSVMILGAESGEIFRTKPGMTSGRTALDIDHFDPHSGPVHGVDTSPFFRNLFLSCSSDGSVRLYSTLERHPLASLEPSVESKHFMYGAQFSPYRAGVFAAVSRSSNLYLFDLEKSKNKPVVTIEAGSQGSAVLCLRFNAANPAMLATGDIRGQVQLWQLASQLYTVTELERAAVRKADGATTSTKEEQEDADADSNPVRKLLGFAL